MLHVISTADLPVRERFDFWWETVATSIVAVDVHSDSAENFRAQMRAVDLGSVQISEVRCPPFHARRTLRLIRKSDAETLQVSVHLSGKSGLRQGHHEAVISAHDVTVYDTSRPFDAWCDHDGHGLILQARRGLVPLPATILERNLAVPMSGRHGLGAVLVGILRHTIEESSHLRTADMARLGTVVLDLLTAVLTGESETRGLDEVHHRNLLLRVHAFIEDHLADESLSPSMIAAAHHISVRSLHRLFQRAGQTVTRSIRQRRLTRCHHDLADPRLAQFSMHAIASRWGCPDPAHFSRAFRAAYGLTPTEFRHAIVRSRVVHQTDDH